MTEEIHFQRKITDNKTIGTTDMHVYENVDLSNYSIVPVHVPISLYKKHRRET
jgi:hypothetical protein